MKRTLPYIGITLILGIIFLTAIPATTYTYVVKELAQTFTALQTFSAGLIQPNSKIVEICASGCEYSTLNVACAAETSTASVPIKFHVQAGTYAAADTMCSGQDHFSIIGDGRGVTSLTGLDHGFGGGVGGTFNCTTTPQACKGAINLGTSTNGEISGMSLYGGRGVWWNGAGTGGGQIYAHDLYMEPTQQNLDEDCFFVQDVVSGTDITYENNHCNSWGDGFTLNESANVAIHGHGNTWRNPSSTLLQIGAAWAFRAIPCLFDSSGDTIYYSGGRPGGAAAASFYGYYFTGTDAKTCASNARIRITSPNVYINNTTPNGFSSTGMGILLDSTVAGVVSFDVTNPQFRIAVTDTTTGQSQGIRNVNTSIIPNVVGGYIRATGGLAANTKDIKVTPGDGTVKINVTGVDFTSDSGSVNLIVAGDQRWLSASQSATFGKAFLVNVTSSNPTIAVTATGTIGLLLDNTNTGTTETSPYLVFKPGTNADTGWFQYADGSANASLHLQTSAAADRLKIDNDGKVTFTGTTNGQSFSISNPGVGLFLGDGNANDNVQIVFNVATDLTMAWIESAKRLNLTGAEQVRFTGKATAPATCSIGDTYIDTSAGVVAWCLCTAANTWTAVGGTGTCA